VRSQIHGGNANNTSAEQDGAATNAYGNFRAPSELIQEINSITVNAPAEYRTSATVAGISKSGTNRPHAEAFLNITNPRLNALPGGVSVRPYPEASQKTWSYEFSGPVYIPKVYDGRNRTFFSVLYQPFSAQSLVYHGDFILPTPEMRAGDLSAYAAFTGKPIIDPLNGQPFSNNTIPTSRFSPVAKNINNYIPPPTLDTIFKANYNFFENDDTKTDWQHYRGDQYLGTGSVLSLSHIRWNQRGTQVWPVSLIGGNVSTAHTRSWSVQFSHTFSPHLVNQASFAYNRQHSTAGVLGADGNLLDGTALLQKFGITDFGGRKTPDIPGGTPFFGVQTLGQQTGIYSGSFNTFTANLIGVLNGGLVTLSDRDETRSHQFRDTLSYQVGTHFFKTGVEVRRQEPDNISVPNNSWGDYEFTGNFTNYDYGDFLLGLPYATTKTTARPVLQQRQWEVGFFIQDDWKIRPNLTLTPGLRFQHYGVPFEAAGLYYNFDLSKLQVVVPDSQALAAVSPAYPKTIPVGTAAQSGFPSRLANFKFMLLDPRMGLAWRPLGPRFVVRAGYGVYHVPYEQPASDSGPLAGRGAGPFQLTENFGPNQIDVNGVASFTLSSPFPSGAGNTGLQSVTYLPLNSRKDAWDYDQQWNLTLERELPFAMVGRISYVGSKGTDWPYTRNLQVPLPGTTPFSASRRPYGPNAFSSILMQDLGGNSTYHGLEVELDRQFSRGLYLRLWYEWKKALNDVQGNLFGGVSGPTIENPNDRSREKGWQDGVLPQKARFVGVYTLPFGRGKQFLSNAPGIVNHVLGNWTIVGNLSFSGDGRFTPAFSGVDTSNTGTSGGRPNQLCNPNNFGSTPGILWNRACFAIPANGTFGNASRGMLSGPWAWTTQFNIFKQWSILGSEKPAYFRLEAYVSDLFNHANEYGPNSLNISNPSFGLFIPVTYEYRQIYLRARLGF
jgi:hypothetical protein